MQIEIISLCLYVMHNQEMCDCEIVIFNIY